MPSERSYSLILIVEQDPVALATLITTLRQAGHQTTGVGGFEEARRQMRLDLPDVLITEARLGAFNGLHLVLLGRSETANFHAIVLGNAPDPILEGEVVRAGGVYLIKPVPHDALIAIIKVLIRGAAADSAMTGITPQTDRRVVERRRLIVPAFTPERRVADRRRNMST